MARRGCIASLCGGVAVGRHARMARFTVLVPIAAVLDSYRSRDPVQYPAVSSIEACHLNMQAPGQKGLLWAW